MCSECNWPTKKEVKFNVKSENGITTVECIKCGNRLIEMQGDASMIGTGHLSCRNCEEKDVK